ncbi:MAG: hypothetical protein IKY33_02460, partial [Clostridia bacterium]|nr:hypothetical protein [Clostridia bacterium]
KPQAWHIITARSAVHIIKGGLPPLYLITRQCVFFLRLDEMQHFVLMIYRNKLRMIYKALPVMHTFGACTERIASLRSTGATLYLRSECII